MITGDHPATAARIARDLGIIPEDGIALPGARLDGMDEQELRETVRSVSVFARVAPEHKLRIVDALQADGHIVAMTGDGVNDAPALKSADIGVAMGITGTEVTKEAAKMVLADDNFATIVHAVREGRVIFDNIRKFLRYLLYSNMGEVLTVFFGIVFAGVLGLTAASEGGLVLPLLATQILWINLVTDSGPALAMGVDPEIDDVMARPPRGLHDRAIDTGMWIGIAVDRPRDLGRHAAHDGHLPARRADPGRHRHARGRPHRRIHDARVRGTLHRVQRPFGVVERLPRAVLERVAVGRRHPRRRAAGRRRVAAAAAGRVRHRDARRRALARLRGDGVDRALGRGDPQDRHPGRRTATGASGCRGA